MACAGEWKLVGGRRRRGGRHARSVHRPWQRGQGVLPLSGSSATCRRKLPDCQIAWWWAHVGERGPVVVWRRVLNTNTLFLVKKKAARHISQTAFAVAAMKQSRWLSAATDTSSTSRAGSRHARASCRRSSRSCSCPRSAAASASRAGSAFRQIARLPDCQRRTIRTVNQGWRADPHLGVLRIHGW